MTLHLALLVVAAAAPSSQQIKTTVSGSIEASLGRHVSARDASMLGAQIARLIRWKGDMVRNVHPGDDLVVVYEPGEPQPELLALAYKGADIDLQAYRFAGRDNIGRFYDEDGALVEPHVLHSPLPLAVQITETVQQGRGKRKHQGVDFKAPEGTPIVAPFGAQVTRVNWSRRVNGNCVELRYSNGKYGRFLHLSHIDKNIRSGAWLKEGQSIGLVGSTGRSSAPHLHYEIRDRGDNVVDPLKLHGTSIARLAESDKAAFTVLRAQLDRDMGSTIASVR